MVSYLLVAGATLLELLCTIFVINGLVGEKRKIPVINAIVFSVFTLMYVLLVPNVLTTGSYLIILLYVKFSYKETWKNSIIVVILNIIMVGLVELLCYFPFAFIVRGILPDEVNNLLASLCGLVLCIIISTYLPIRDLKDWCKKKEVSYIAVVIFSLVLMLTAFTNLRITLQLDLIDYIYISMAVLLMWVLSVRLLKYRYEEKIRKKYFEAFCSVIDQIRRRQHKFRNQMDAVYSMHKLYGDYKMLVEAQREYLGKLEDYEMPADVLVLENPIIIAHVYEKIMEAQEAGIHIKMKLSCELSDCGVKDIHMIEIIGTLLDNAIQDMVENGKTKFLRLEIKREDGISIQVANPHEKLKISELKKMFDKGVSSKGEGRGIGLYNVKQLAKKYKIDFMVENKIYEDENYICFSAIIGKSTLIV